VGARNFLGNNIAYPAGARLGENVLLATKVMVPIDGPIRENIGLLGSPPFEIPRSAGREDAELDLLNDPWQVRRRLAAKNRANAAGIGLVLLIRYAQFLANLLLGAIALNQYSRFGTLAIAAALVAALVFNPVYAAVIERAVRGFRPLTPRSCSIYDRYFWGHELLWKVYIKPIFTGTPFNPAIWRLAGVRMGRRVFDDGAAIPEKTLTTIGDDTILNAGCVLQGHSLEDGLFKSGYTAVGAGCTVGINAFVHYGVSMGDGAVLDADSFLMKGAEVGAHEWWQGNPANQIKAPESAGWAVGAAPLPRRPKLRAGTTSTRAMARRDRVQGVDVARGLALFGMMAVHVFPTFGADGSPTVSTYLASGRSAATFALLAGLGLTFLSGGRQAVRGRARTAASVGIAVRAVLIGLIGLALGYTGQANVILPYYAVLFLLAIPLLGLSRKVLTALCVLVLGLAPLVLVSTFGAGLPYSGAAVNPTFATLVQDPLGLVVELFLTGSYPVIAYLAYLLAGLAIGRLDLASAKVAGWLFGGGLALAVASWFASSALLSQFGGLAQLTGAAGTETDPARALNVILWEPVRTAAPNWWWLALRAPHSHATLDLLQTLGSAMAVLGLALLVCRVRFVARTLWPLAVAGSMTLTFYSAHLVVLATGVMSDQLPLLYAEMVVGALLLAMVFRLLLGRGPMEWLVSFVAGWSRWAVATWLARGGPGSLPVAPPLDVRQLAVAASELEARQLAPPPVDQPPPVRGRPLVA
ncbi:MAG TPA: DapH/DapD/GlmU-related protein, partial [Pseudonocardia sp.]|nr:DapH/DapD/GlmU-related protein [Pseudonocardia sp.]